MRVRLNDVAANYFSYPVSGSRENKRLATKINYYTLLGCCIRDACRECISFSLHHLIVTVKNSYVKLSIA